MRSKEWSAAERPIGGNVVDADWQRLWFSTLNNLETPWTSLAVTATGRAADVATVAARIAAMARENGNAEATVLEATGAAPAEVPGLMARLAALTGAGTRVIVAADSPAENPGLIPLIRASSGVLLLVRLRETTLHANRETVAAIEGSTIIGSIVIG
jgi:hypothetical protein